MPKKIVQQGVAVFRDKQIAHPEIGKEFDFTEAELADIERLNPDAVREPINESAPVAKAKAGAKADL